MIEDAIILQSCVGLAALLILTCLGFAFLDKLFTKSREYRKLMVDMFVVGKTKQIAEKEGVDLMVELKEFAKVMKQNKIDCEGLDSTIERELQEKIANVSLTEKEKK